MLVAQRVIKKKNFSKKLFQLKKNMFSFILEGDSKCNIAYNTLQCYIDTQPALMKSNFEFLFD